MTLITSALVPGSELDPCDPFAGPQTVTDVQLDLAAGLVHITTCDAVATERHWTFRANEVPGFPRRPDGSTYDWRRQSTTTPTARHLAFGDLLPAADGSLDAPPQVVVAVLRAAYRGRTPSDPQATPRVRFEVRTMTYVPGLPQQMRRFYVSPDEELHFPRGSSADAGARASTPARLRPARAYEPGVTYVNVETGATFRFLRHEFGRGRWPASAPAFDPDLPPRADGRPHVTRPPRNRDHRLTAAATPGPGTGT